MALSKSEMMTISSIMLKADHRKMEQIADMFNEARRMQAAVKKHQFTIGDKVAFVNRRNGRIEGVVTKKLRSNLVVKTSEGQQWRVSPAALQAA